MKKIKIPLLGIHNVRNSVAAIGVALTVGISIRAIKKGLLSFKGVQRRFNFLFKKERYLANKNKIKITLFH